MKILNSAACCLALSLLVACEETTHGTPGELGEGDFSYVCLSDYDTGCASGTYDTPVPDTIAVGSTFNLQFYGDSSRIVSGSESMVKPIANGFLAVGEGNVAMLAEGTAHEQIIDFIHVELQVAEALQLTGLGADGATFLKPGESWKWSVTPKGSKGSPLAGSAMCLWTSSDPSVLTISQSTETNINTIRGVAPGTARVTVTLGDVSDFVEVTVEGE